MARLSTSSSSNSSSALRVSRNWYAPWTVIPGNSSPTKVDKSEERNTKSCGPPLTFSGIWMMRDSERGARTMAYWPSRPKASRPSRRTTMLSDLLSSFGNGCAGSRPSGDSTGITLLRK